jgi:hypothetical protein
MDLADEAGTQRKAAAQAGEAVLQRRHVVRDLHDVVHRHPRRLLHLEEEKVGGQPRTIAQSSVRAMRASAVVPKVAAWTSWRPAWVSA